MSQILIIKSTGEKEAFEPAKLLSSLTKAGANRSEAERALLHIQRELVNGMTTNEIYRHAFDVLRHSAHPVALRYSMKRAISDLGPAGFPFEKFVAEIFRAEGYEALTDQIVQGHCVEHEVDVVAWKGDELVLVEAKFHNEPGLKSDLKVALYVRARFDDLRDGVYEYGGKSRKVTSFQLFTNTKFTDHAIRYAECQGLSLVGWNYPRKGNLEDLVNEAGLHPLTSLTTLSQMEKKSLLDAGLVLCKHVREYQFDLPNYGIDRAKIKQILEEVDTLCG
ncbi:MAG TPA: ATP cone domain-containing protein [Candidatus Paceibacterota bacterium]